MNRKLSIRAIAITGTRVVPVLLLSAALAGCVSQTLRTVDMTPPEQISADRPEHLLMDVGVAVFDPNVPEDIDEREEQGASQAVREAEARYMAYTLKNMLQSTGNWGAVRVVPRPTQAVEVVVQGRILHSNGESLALEVQVDDASGRRWFKRKYEVMASRYSYDPSVPREIDPFQAIYRRISDDMLAYLQAMPVADVEQVQAVAQLRFASEFAPDSFDGYVRQQKGRWELARLPADGDPMLERVERVREREYLFIDTLDEYYADFHERMSGPYQDWRQYGFEEAAALRQLQDQARNRTALGALAVIGGLAAAIGGNDSLTRYAGHVAVLGGAWALKSGFDKRGEAKIHQEALGELATSLESEIAPHVIELDHQTVTLTGTVDQQYDQLRAILRKIYHEERGLPLPDAPVAQAADS